VPTTGRGRATSSTWEGGAATILAAHPGLRGTVVDQAAPVRGAVRTLRERGLSGRATAVVGDFFEPLPAGAGCYVLSAVIHDWDDDPAVAILRRCAEAAGAGGVVLVVENLGDDGESTNTAMDLLMLVCNGGRERGLAGLRELATRAGMAVVGVHPVGRRPTVSIVELRPVPGAAH
jgi:2,7-dihydroxy-5-methyl-1-naphthoate 7-O-methyltransferase